MNERIPTSEVIKKGHSLQLVLKSLIIIFLMAAVTVFILYFSLGREMTERSYGESYRIIASLRDEILNKSVLIYVSTFAIIAIGIAVLTLLYSHRVAGPLFRLEMFSRKIASGDFTELVRFRKGDLIHPLAEDFNTIISMYGDVVGQTDAKIEKLKGSLAEVGRVSGSATGAEFTQAVRNVSGTVEELAEILSRIKL